MNNIHSTAGHTIIVGATGMGKSSLLREHTRAAMNAGHGLVLLDPHGDLSTQVIADVPRRRKNDLIVVDPANPSCPGINPLRRDAGMQPEHVASIVIAIARRLWATSWGPRSEHILRFTLMAAAEVRGTSFLDVTRMLTEPHHRSWVVRQVRDEVVRAFFLREFPGYGERLQAEATAPILNKVHGFLASPTVRAVVTKRRPVLSAENALARSSIVIVRLAKGEIGEDNGALLGGLLLGMFQRAVYARAALPVQERHPFHIIADEMSSFVTTPFTELMSEARKFNAQVCAASQTLSMLDAGTRAGLLANASKLIVFRLCSAEDARLMQDEFVGRFGPQTLMRLDVGERIVRDGARDAYVVPANPLGRD